MALVDREGMAGRSQNTLKELLANGGDPADFIWPFNGMRADGQKYGMDVPEFIAWAQAMHPEFIDFDAGLPSVLDFVFTESDESIMGIEGLAGTVMVTIRPDIDSKDISYAKAAVNAGLRYPANKKVQERFFKLAAMFAEEEK